MDREHHLPSRIEDALSHGEDLSAALAATVGHLGADTGTIHLLGQDGALHLTARSGPIPDAVLALIDTIPVGKGMAGLAVARMQPVTTCNLQTDASGDVRPGARATELQGAIVVPILRGPAAIGALGIGCRGPRQFTSAETELLQQVGERIARTARGTRS